MSIVASGNPTDSEAAITPPVGGPSAILASGVAGNRSASYTATQAGLHSLFLQITGGGTLATLTVQCTTSGGGAGLPGSTAELIDLVMFDPSRIFIRVPGSGDFPLNLMENASALPRDRVLFEADQFYLPSDFNGDGLPDGRWSPVGVDGFGFDPPDFGQRVLVGSVPTFYAPQAQSGAFDLTMNSDQLIAHVERERRARAADMLGGIKGVAGVDAYVPTLSPVPLWHFWVSGRVGAASRGPAGATIDSDIGEFTAGAYRSDRQTGATTGGFLNVRTAGGEIPGQLDIDGEAVGAALFHIRPLGGGVLGKVAVMFEGGEADANVGGATGSFDFTTWQVEGEIAAHRDFGTWWVRPRANLFYAVMDRGGYTDSTGAAIAGGGADMLRLSFGPTFGARVWAGDGLGWVAPYLGIEGEWDIVGQGGATALNGTPIGSDNFNFRLSGGIHSTFGGIATTTIEASLLGGGGGGGDEAAEVRGSVNVPLN